MGIAPDKLVFHVGPVTQSSTDRGNIMGDRWLLPVISPVLDSSQTVQGYIVGVIDPTVFENFYATLEVGEHGLVMLWDNDGVFVAGSENADWETGYLSETMAKRMASYSGLFDELDRYSAYTYSVDTESNTIVTSYLGLEQLSLGASIALDGRDFLKPWDQAHRRIVIGSFLFLSILAGLTLLLLKQIKQQEKSEAQLTLAKEEAEQANLTKN